MIKAHLEGHLSDIDPTRVATVADTVHDWLLKREPGALVKQPEGQRWILETPNEKRNDATTKLFPELTADKAQVAIDEWILTKLDSLKEMILRRPLKANERTKDTVNTLVLVAAGNAVVVNGWTHVATVHVYFHNMPVKYRPIPPKGLLMTAEQAQQLEWNRDNLPEVTALYSGPGEATFSHDTDGKWFLVEVQAVDPNSEGLSKDAAWPLSKGIEVKF